MTCVKCRISATCPEKGSSPLMIDGKLASLCSLIGGYGRKEVDLEVLSTSSLLRSAKDGKCVTFAKVPAYEDGFLFFKDVMIFSMPVLHEREVVK